MSDPRFAASLFVLPMLMTGCVVTSDIFEGRPCPCGSGWTCNEARVCVPGEATDAGLDAHDGGADADAAADSGGDAPDSSDAPDAGLGPRVLRVLHGTEVMNTTTTELDVTPTEFPVNLSRSVLFFGVATDTEVPSRGHIAGELLDAPMRIQFRRAAATDAVTIVWHLIEFSSGVSVQRGSFLGRSGASLREATIAEVPLETSFVLVSFGRMSSSLSDDDTIRGWLPRTDLVQLSTGTNGIGDDLSWQVVTMPGAMMENGNRTLGETDPRVTVSVSSAGTGSFPLASWAAEETPDSGVYGPGALWLHVGSSETGEVQFERAITGPRINLVYSVITIPGAEVFSRDEGFGGADLTRVVPIGATVDIDRSVAFSAASQRFGSTSYDGAPQSPGVASFTFELIDDGDGTASTLRVTRGLTGGAPAAVTWLVVELPR